MNETMVTVVGNAATSADYRTTQSGVPAVRFRLAATVRRFDQASGSWTDAYTNFFTVWAWRQLAENVAASVSIGEPLLVRGRLRVREYEKEGARVLDPTIDATAVGHDLGWGTAAFHRMSRLKPSFADPGPPDAGRTDPRRTDPGGAAAGRAPDAGEAGERQPVLTPDLG
ncbi:single-stranded DNA-binding protein [Streptomyces sp. MAR4 CNX-425]|uniref:single-stranded DNA-binding protein n=1 Tax=Streptomyces sp. MAR4 CNX-425 TaxID=3406343 RepID=UPI003B5053FF